MKVVETKIDGVLELRPTRHGDDRGWFSEVWNERALASAGIDLTFVQDNEAFSKSRGTLRGLHYQVAPFAQDKLVRAVAGTILDVAVDLRAGSPTYGQHVARELSAEVGNQLLVPTGFAHGYCTLTADTVIAYKVTNYYSAEHDRGIRWDDPALGIEWPFDGTEAVLSEKDRAAPLLAELQEVPFPA